MINHRRQEILSSLSLDNYTKISDLASKFDVSVVTIRNDISKMEEDGLVVRYHGKVRLANLPPIIPYSVRKDENFVKKQLIARRAAELIQPGDSIMLDAGTTTMMIADQIQGLSSVNVITNSISVTDCLAKTEHSVTLLGGMLLSKSMCTVGPTTEKELASLECERLFLGCTGVRGTIGLTTGVVLEAMVKRAMIDISKEVIAVFDDSKFDQAGIHLFAKLNQIDTIITTRPAKKPPALSAAADLGIRIIYADE